MGSDPQSEHPAYQDRDPRWLACRRSFLEDAREISERVGEQRSPADDHELVLEAWAHFQAMQPERIVERIAGEVVARAVEDVGGVADAEVVEDARTSVQRDLAARLVTTASGHVYVPMQAERIAQAATAVVFREARDRRREPARPVSHQRVHRRARRRESGRRPRRRSHAPPRPSSSDDDPEPPPGLIGGAW